MTRLAPQARAVASLLFVCAASVRAQAPSAVVEAALARVEQDMDIAEGELLRIEVQYREVPNLFTTEDRGERMAWGEIYYLTKEYQRASMLLFGAVEPREGERPLVEQLPGYADALYYLADSLFLAGNVSAAQGYFEKLLKLRGHPHHEQAILRLMEICDEERRTDDIDRYYAEYLQIAGKNIPGQVRYLRGKSLFLAKKDREALDELSRVPPSEAFALRSRYIMGAALVRMGRYDDALAVFQQVAFAQPIAPDDQRVKEQAHLARGRLFYQADKLAESIDAYQEISYDSPLLTTMLYEVTWTYVRRGQLALRAKSGDDLTAGERRELANLEYEKALDQLEDLRSLEPDSERGADIAILAGNLQLQRSAFDKAAAAFDDVLLAYRDTDRQMSAQMGERSSRERLLRDILAMSAGGLAVDSKLPAAAARRASANPEVAKALRVFQEIQQSRDEIASASKLLDELENQLSLENPTRTELFKPLQSGVDRSSSLENTLLGLQQRAIAVVSKISLPPPELAARLQALRTGRATLEAKTARLPKTPAAIAGRKKTLFARLTRIDNALHEAELEARQRRAELTAIDFMYTQDSSAAGSALTTELRKNPLREARVAIEEIERIAQGLREQLALTKKNIATAGGRGSAEDTLRIEYARSFQEERTLLASARDPSKAQLYSRVEKVLAKADALGKRNEAFRARLDDIVQERLAGSRALLASQKDALRTYVASLGDIDTRAAAVRDTAATVALEKVRQELSRIVLRADVGIADTSFARKQLETDKLGQLQRARAAELTDLTQAYADLTKDESP